MSLYHALAMLWMTFEALVLGFSISAALHVFVSKQQMSRAFGKTNLKSIAVATGLGGGEQPLLLRGGGSRAQRGAAGGRRSLPQWPSCSRRPIWSSSSGR